MKYGSFIKKMAEDFDTGWENVYLIHIQAYHDKWKKQQDNHDKVTCPQRITIILPLGMYPI